MPSGDTDDNSGYWWSPYSTSDTDQPMYWSWNPGYGNDSSSPAASAPAPAPAPVTVASSPAVVAQSIAQVQVAAARGIPGAAAELRRLRAVEAAQQKNQGMFANTTIQSRFMAELQAEDDALAAAEAAATAAAAAVAAQARTAELQRLATAWNSRDDSRPLQGTYDPETGTFNTYSTSDTGGTSFQIDPSLVSSVGEGNWTAMLPSKGYQTQITPEPREYVIAAGGDPALYDEYEDLVRWVNTYGPGQVVGDEGYQKAMRAEQLALQFLDITHPNRGSGGGWGSFFKGIPRAAGGMAKTLAQNPAVMAAITGGLSTPASIGGTALMTPLQAAAATGAVTGAASSDNPLTGAFKGAGIGAASYGAGDYAGTMFQDTPWLSGLARGGAGALTGAVLSRSADPIMAAGQGAVIGGLSGLGQQSKADVDFDQLMASVGPDIDLDAMQVVDQQPAARGGYDPLTDISAGMRAMQALGLAPKELITPINYGEAATFTPADQIARQSYQNAGLLPLAGTALEPIAEDSEAPEGEPTTTAKKPTTGDYVKYAKKVYDLFKQMGFGVDTPEYVMPEQTEEMSEEEYQALVGESLVDYFGLRPEDYAGMTPGSQEFLDYILGRADALIADVFGSDPAALLQGEDVESIQAALRDLTENEAQELMRAMYVRGALGRTSTQTEAVDPFSGETVEIGKHEGEADKAAWQVGLARTLADIARDPNAADRLRGLLGRNVDIYGMTAAAEARNEAARKASEQEEDRLDEEEEAVDEYGNPISKAERRRRRLARKQRGE